MHLRSLKEAESKAALNKKPTEKIADEQDESEEED